MLIVTNSKIIEILIDLNPVNVLGDWLSNQVHSTMSSSAAMSNRITFKADRMNKTQPTVHTLQ